MSQITFEKLKEKCVQEFCSKNTRGFHGELSGTKQAGLMSLAVLIDLKRTGKPKKSNVLIKEIEDDCVKVIEATDIRNLEPLKELCPDSFPKWMSEGNYNIELGENGWEIFSKN